VPFFYYNRTENARHKNPESTMNVQGEPMNLTLTINGIEHPIDCPPHTTLLTALRGLGFHSVKFGDEHGLTGSDTILLDGKPVNATLVLAAQAEGHKIATLEALGEHPEQGWRKTDGLHPLQQAFIESGAIQCGYCTPAQILAAKALLDKNPESNRSRSARSPGWRAMPLYGLPETGAGSDEGGEWTIRKQENQWTRQKW
jgi:aerobic-type carbon monoxide dehydrogenase small subunit (CoxS/CutS family)